MAGIPLILLIATILFILLGLIFICASIAALRNKRFLKTTTRFTSALLLLCLGVLGATIAVSIQGYRALTHEEIAAIVQVTPVGPKHFNALFQFPDGHRITYQLFGDEIYVDARILKWRPIVNIFGLHTSYELDRVSGRYIRIEEEREKERTIFTLSHVKPLDMFNLRRRYAFLRPLVDAKYGSAAFIIADKPATFELRVSITGLMIRRVKRRIPKDTQES